jgi:hypothetical protein
MDTAYAESPIRSSPIYLPESIKAGGEANFSVKITNTGSLFASEIRPVVEVMPKSAGSFVHVTASANTTLWGGYSDIVRGTIQVNKEIPHERIFVAIYFVAKDEHGRQILLVNSENSFALKIDSSDDCCKEQSEKLDAKPEYTHVMRHGHFKYFVPYAISGGKLHSMQLDCTSGVLLIHLQEAVDGTLTITIPRKMLDSRVNTDMEFIVIVDGLEAESAEIHSDEKVRTMEIQFNKNSNLIEVIAALWPGEAYCGTGDDKESQYYRLLTPLQQLKSGTPSQYVVCGQGMELALKTSNGQPVCIRQETKQMLLSTKWAEPARIMG